MGLLVGHGEVGWDVGREHGRHHKGTVAVAEKLLLDLAVLGRDPSGEDKEMIGSDFALDDLHKVVDVGRVDSGHVLDSGVVAQRKVKRTQRAGEDA